MIAGKNYARYSFWLETAGDDLTPRRALDGSATVDVAILGAGFTGLWTAYYLLRRQPSLRIAVVEREIAGFGASGRNGGWCSPRFSVSPSVLRQRVGRDAARAVFLTMCDAVDEVGRIAAVEGIDAGFVKDGSLRVALGPHHLPSLHDAQAAFEALGMGERYQMLDAAIRPTSSTASHMVKNTARAASRPTRWRRTDGDTEALVARWLYASGNT